jgi:pimeloyl-ACP methyl ester carboxylesterase/predicted glycosyltransferase
MTMRAVEPDRASSIERDGVKVFYEVFGEGNQPTVLLLPTWSILHSRHWKAQVPDLARRYRVVTIDGRGNGLSDRPASTKAYAPDEFVADCIAVLDATKTDRAIVVGLSFGSTLALLLAALHADRVSGAVMIAPGELADDDVVASGSEHGFDAELEAYDGWDKLNRHYWQTDYRGFLEFFIGQCLSEPHSTKQIEDGVEWGLETDPETLARTAMAMGRSSAEMAGEPDRALASAVRCPTLVIQGDDDHLAPDARGKVLADLIGADLVTIAGGGHNPQARHPVLVNRLLRDFVDRVSPPPRRHRTWTRALHRPLRALYVSSPIGLGHAQRDIAVAEEMRTLRPDLEIHWLAQHPVTAVLETRGERIHPASRFLASESAHIQSECHEHDLHAFQALRRMDEILISNFGVFDDLLGEEHYDLVIGDEAWDLDYFLHENPELKRTSFVWMTDFVGWLPMAEGGEREAALTADYNAEMIEQVARFRRLRDRSIFVGDPDDIVGDAFGPDLPAIRDWTEDHFDFAGYVTGFDPVPLADREGLRAELGYNRDEQVCIVTVGGSGVGGSLLRKVIAAYPMASRLVAGLRMVVVAGPRIDPASLAAPPGVEVRAFVPDLYRHLAACDVAVVQGGLTTTMELTAAGRPFLYFPLANHFEQQHHVRHRLERYGAGRCLDYASATPEDIATELAAALAAPVRYREVASDGAARAARLITELL